MASPLALQRAQQRVWESSVSTAAVPSQPPPPPPQPFRQLPQPSPPAHVPPQDAANRHPVFFAAGARRVLAAPVPLPAIPATRMSPVALGYAFDNNTNSPLRQEAGRPTPGRNGPGGDNRWQGTAARVGMRAGWSKL